MRLVPQGFEVRSLQGTWRNIQVFSPAAALLGLLFLLQNIFVPVQGLVPSQLEAYRLIFSMMVVWFGIYWGIARHLNRIGRPHQWGAYIFTVFILLFSLALTLLDNTYRQDMSALCITLFVLPVGIQVSPKVYRWSLLPWLFVMAVYIALMKAFTGDFWVSLVQMIGFTYLSILVQRSLYQSRLDRYMFQLRILETNAELEKLATQDSLTGLYNRRHFEQLYLSEWQRSLRHFHPFSVLSVDLDHFKRINDTMGHPVGDEVLRQAGALLTSMLRRSDHAARVGGEEFMIVLVETQGEGAAVFAERFRKALSLMAASQELPNAVTASIGIATSVEVSDSQELLKLADQRLYKAKAQGRNCVVQA